MASRDFLPGKESELVTWAQQFGTLATATPIAFGLTAAQMTAYTTLLTAYVSAYNTAKAGTTRSPVNITLKNTARKALVANIRMLARIVQATPTVTPAQKQSLGLNPRDNPVSPIQPPSIVPSLDVVSVEGHTVKIRAHDAGNPTRRGKPNHVYGMVVLSYVGEEAPSDPNLYRNEGTVTRTTVEVMFPQSVPGGSKVWLTCAWFSPRQQMGPLCPPVPTYLQVGGPMLQLASGYTKQAA